MKKSSSKPIDLFKSANSTGDLIKAFRNNFDIKQEEMAYACNISQANLSAIEKNKREIGIKVALKISAFMGVDPSIVLFPNDYKREPAYLEVRERAVEYNKQIKPPPVKKQKI